MDKRKSLPLQYLSYQCVIITSCLGFIFSSLDAQVITYPTDIEAEHYKIGITTSFELMQEVFSNVSKGSGAIVISAAAGNSYALESDQWKNGVFTYALLNGMKNKRADKNKDGIITVTEIKDFVSIEVEKLTKGEQRPTSRRENLEFDFRVW